MTLYFPDVSGWNAGISLAGALAVCAKGTQGRGYRSSAFDGQRREAARHGTYFTGYHFMEEGDGAGQADNAFAVAGRDTPWMLDLEPMDPPQGSSYPSIADGVAFIRRFRELGGIIHWLYLPRWYWARGANGLGGASLKPFTDLGMLLWSSAYGNYTDSDSGYGWQSYGGMPVTIWQYTSSMHFGGQANVDFSAFRGSKYAGKQGGAAVAAALAEFQLLSRTGKYAAPKKPPPPPPPLDGKTVTVPNVRGLTAARAHHLISASHLNPDTGGVAGTAIVTGTTPDGTAPLGTTIGVHASKAPELLVDHNGRWVSVAQTDLNRDGAHLGVDGRFGAATLAAVMAFQKSHHLGADGIIGPATWAALGNQ